MANTTTLINYIQNELRERKITYRELGNKIELSESAVKQMFAAQNFSLERLDQIAGVFNMEMSDLVGLCAKSQPEKKQFSIKQEWELVNDPQFAAVAIAAMNHLDASEIMEQCNIDEPKLISYLIRLERIGMIKLGVNNVIKPQLSSNFTWRRDGPIENYVRHYLLDDVFNSDFSRDDTSRIYIGGYLTKESRVLLNLKISALTSYFVDLCKKDANIKLPDRQHTGLIACMRKWTFSPDRVGHGEK